MVLLDGGPPGRQFAACAAIPPQGIHPKERRLVAREYVAAAAIALPATSLRATFWGVCSGHISAQLDVGLAFAWDLRCTWSVLAKSPLMRSSLTAKRENPAVTNESLAAKKEHPRSLPILRMPQLPRGNFSVHHRPSWSSAYVCGRFRVTPQPSALNTSISRELRLLKAWLRLSHWLTTLSLTFRRFVNHF